MKKLIVLSSVFFVALSGILSPGLYAQDTLEEIVVTARKRQENLSETRFLFLCFQKKTLKKVDLKTLKIFHCKLLVSSIQLKVVKHQEE